MTFYPFQKKFADLASVLQPKISVNQAKEAIRLLEKIGLITKDNDNFWGPTDRNLHSAPEMGKAVKGYHLEMADLAKSSIDLPAKERNITAITGTVDDEAFEDIKDIIEECRRAIRKRIDEVEEPNRVMQMNFQVFPLSQTMEDNK